MRPRRPIRGSHGGRGRKRIRLSRTCRTLPRPSGLKRQRPSATRHCFQAFDALRLNLGVDDSMVNVLIGGGLVALD